MQVCVRVAVIVEVYERLFVSLLLRMDGAKMSETDST